MLVATITIAVLASGAPAQATDGYVRSATDGYVKYYVVAEEYRGRPEYLAEIAVRFLGDPQRAQEIMDLNADREQPDGGRLTDPNRLHPGWVLILPWDAYGEGVQFGPLPTTVPSQPSTPPAPPVSGEVAAGCGVAGQKPDNTDDGWGALRLGANRAWPVSIGAGVLVAVIDSGVDANLPAFAGRVVGGADIVAGSGRGDTDCLGFGTALASIVAGSGEGSSPGVAPGAVILPVRVIDTPGPARVPDQVAAIDFAVAAGAHVLLLGDSITPADPTVAAAIATATANDAVVVLSAGAALPSTMDGVLRVAPVAIDGSLHGTYPAGAVDLVAPGVAVTGLGISGAGAVELTGAQYAAAYAAGVAALVRARFPTLDAAQVVHRLLVTAAPMAGTNPDGPFGAGMVDPAVAVTRVLLEETPAPLRPVEPEPAPPHPLRSEALVLIGVLGLGTAVTLVLRLRRVIRPPDDPPLAVEQPGASAAERAGVVSPGPLPAPAVAQRPRLDVTGMTAPSLDAPGSAATVGGVRSGAGHRAPAHPVTTPESQRIRAVHSGQDGD